MAFGIDDAIAAGLQIINKFVPDPQQREQAAFELAQLKAAQETAQLNADVQLATAQTDINKTEAASESLFISGWRPAIGWICGLAFFYHFILQPFLIFMFSVCGRTIPTPTFDMNTLYTVLMGLLGLGTMRTVEKIKG